ncbi:MAG: type I 3-dehydroquinate dehydratase [Roseibacillus sp.]|nr:type I 3-dehydroquinate dehydratase [Roseibacillus sp.]
MENLTTLLQSRQPLVVGAAGNQKALEHVYSVENCDLVELRLDCLGNGEEVHNFAERQRRSLPLLMTARHPDEGGMNQLSKTQRAELLSEFLPAGRLLDLELQSLKELGEIWESAADTGMIRIASWHDFNGCPSREQLRDILEEMAAAGADIAKCAFALAEPSDLQRIAEALEDTPLPLSIMGMGSLAPTSRLLAADLGSALNYGYLGKDATAPGQWPAKLLREAISCSTSP